MNTLKYNSDNEQGFLKSFGPYKLMSAGLSTVGLKLPKVTIINNSKIINNVKIYTTKVETKGITGK